LLVAGRQASIEAGWMPRWNSAWITAGRRSERGRIPLKYQLFETNERNYVVRTERNVVDSDGTLVLFRNQMTGGTELTHRLAQKHGKPHLCLDLVQVSLAQDDFDEVKQHLFDWLSENQIEILNVAGPRESTSAGIQADSRMFLVAALRAIRPI
jgi:hypothetical protein